jgi:hypothetical protein
VAGAFKIGNPGNFVTSGRPVSSLEGLYSMELVSLFVF